MMRRFRSLSLNKPPAFIEGISLIPTQFGVRQGTGGSARPWRSRLADSIMPSMGVHRRRYRKTPPRYSSLVRPARFPRAARKSWDASVAASVSPSRFIGSPTCIGFLRCVPAISRRFKGGGEPAPAIWYSSVASSSSRWRCWKLLDSAQCRLDAGRDEVAHRHCSDLKDQQ